MSVSPPTGERCLSVKRSGAASIRRMRTAYARRDGLSVEPGAHSSFVTVRHSSSAWHWLPAVIRAPTGRALFSRAPGRLEAIRRPIRTDNDWLAGTCCQAAPINPLTESSCVDPRTEEAEASYRGRPLSLPMR